MVQKTSRFERFWKELKRRKVFGVVTTYAATGYIIIEVINNLIAPFHLPEWIPTVVGFILVTGLPVAIILAWIFDFTPKGIKKTESLEESESRVVDRKPVRQKLRASYVLNAVLLIIVAVLAYPRIFKRDTFQNLREKGKISVAVMPFRNITNDTIWNIWQNGFQNILINLLSNTEGLQIRQAESINNLVQSNGSSNYAALTSIVEGIISKKLDADIFIDGNIIKSANTLRLNAQLIDTKTNVVIKSFQTESMTNGGNIFGIIDSLAMMVTNYLSVSIMQEKLPVYQKDYSYNGSPEAYRCFLYGEDARSKRDYPTARKMFLQALAIDSNFNEAALLMSVTCINQGSFDEAKKWGLIAYKKRESMPIRQKILLERNHAYLFETSNEELKYLKQFLKIDDQNPTIYYDIGLIYNNLAQYYNAIPEFEKSLELFALWDTKPRWVYNYTLLGIAYHATGQYQKEKKLYKKAEKDFSNDAILTSRQAILSITKGDTAAANRYIKKYISIRKSSSATEAGILYNLAVMYSDAGVLDIAEKYHRKVLDLEPEKASRLAGLGNFLIIKNRNISEGLKLIEKALVLRPNDYLYLDVKGQGLLKQGKSQEALEILQKSWDLRMKNAVYNYEAFQHLEAAKKAVAWMKN